MDIKNQLIKSAKAIKKKTKILRDREDSLDLQRRKMFKPIIQPLEAMMSPQETDDVKFRVIKKDSNEDYQDRISSSLYKDAISKVYNELGSDSKNKLLLPDASEKFHTPSCKLKTKKDRKKSLQVPFGIRTHDDQLFIGNSPVAFSNIKDGELNNSMELIKVGEKNYELTSGLTELLYESKPKLEAVTDKDKLIYKDILCHTNAHKRNFDAANQIKGDKGLKYCKIIKPLFNKTESEDIKQGGTLPLLKTYKKNTDFVYWDDPNELIDRLKILIASKDAGNTSHDNEIISIIEELYEAGIIIQ